MGRPLQPAELDLRLVLHGSHIQVKTDLEQAVGFLPVDFGLKINAPAVPMEHRVLPELRPTAQPVVLAKADLQRAVSRTPS